MANRNPSVRVRLDGQTLDVIEDQASENECSREARIRYLLRVALRLQGLVKRPAVLAALAAVPKSAPDSDQAARAQADEQIRQMLQLELSGN